MTPQAPITTDVAAWRATAPITLTPVLQGALESFHARGYHGATIRDIAERAGVTLPTLYHYHGSKQGVLIALLDVAHAAAEARFHAAVEAADNSTDRLSNMIEAVVLHITHHVGLASLDSEMKYLDDESRQYYAEKMHQMHRLLVGILDEGNRSGEFLPSDSALSARSLIGMCFAIPLWYQHGGRNTPEEIARAFARTALLSVGVPVHRIEVVGA